MKAVLVLILALLVVSGTTAMEDEAELPVEGSEDMEVTAGEDLFSDSNVTTATQLLVSLPPREDKPQVAVDGVKDRTGQVDPETGSSVVSQGAEEMLITALKRSGQYKVLERTAFDALDIEQQLQDEGYLDDEMPESGELLGAQYKMTGAITEYQIDKETGGLGISIAGIGGSKEKAIATAAVDLRLVDTTTGEVIWARSLQGEVEGERVGAQAFTFLGQNIVELETGKGKQDVINLMVRTLLEEAVYQMVEAGI